MLTLPAYARLYLDRTYPINEPDFNRYQLKYNEQAFSVQKNFEKIEQQINYSILSASDTGSISASTGITNISPVTRVQGNGAAIDITASPQISAGSDGQELRIEGMSDTYTVKLDDGDGLQTQYGQSFTLGSGDYICFVYNSTAGVWREQYRANN